MRRSLLFLLFLLLSLFFAFPALGGHWWENWGTMVWGAVATISTMGWLAGALLSGLFNSAGLRRVRLAGTGLGLLLALAYTNAAEAVVTYEIVGGQLMGASGVSVDGVLYDVQFIDGSCIELFDGCDEASDFEFQTFDAARSGAMLALLDQVLVDTGIPGQDFESSVDLVNGCSATNQCLILTPFTVDPELKISMLINRPLPSSDTLVGGTGNPFDPAQSTVSEVDRVYAVWSLPAEPTPVPALSLPGVAILVSGLLGLGAGSSWRARRVSARQGLD